MANQPHALTLVLPFPDAERSWSLWAAAEEGIDFRRQRFAAERCTICFAAQELKKYLTKCDPLLAVQVSERRPDSGRFIEFQVDNLATGGGFIFRPEQDGLLIIGDGRNGVINGAYEFLRAQGWQWLEPGEAGESPPGAEQRPHAGTWLEVPADQAAEFTLRWPQAETVCSPSFRYRCLDAYRLSQDSVEYLLWMARNHLNVYFRKPATGKLADKLGMLSRRGGHLLQNLLKPDRYLPSGRTIWEDHPEWYGVPEEGVRQQATACQVQLCVSQSSLLEFLGDEMVGLLNGTYSDIDIVDVWGFDTWGATCACASCKAAGNGADQNLMLLSALRSALDQAAQEGRLDRKVLMNTCAYDGTVTLTGPTRPIPANLTAAGDICITYPILRCYSHDFDATSCAGNRRHKQALESWTRHHGKLSLWMGEYYNVSKFEDLPVLFMDRMVRDMRLWRDMGVEGMTYMHAISVNWGMRALTQAVHARFAWDVDTPEGAFFSEYFQRRYGPYAEAMRGCYDQTFAALQDAAAWRGWRDSVLNDLMAWDGRSTGDPLTFLHAKGEAEMIASGRRSVELLAQAFDAVSRLVMAERERAASAGQSAESTEAMSGRLEDARRSLVYARDMMQLLTAMLEYHLQTVQGQPAPADHAWQEVTDVAEAMSLYYAPIAYENPGAGLISKDALTRTQARPLLTRWRRARRERNESA